MLGDPVVRVRRRAGLALDQGLALVVLEREERANPRSVDPRDQEALGVESHLVEHVAAGLVMLPDDLDGRVGGQGDRPDSEGRDSAQDATILEPFECGRPSTGRGHRVEGPAFEPSGAVAASRRTVIRDRS